MAEGGLHGESNAVPMEVGTPQGGIIPPTLANLTLDGLGRLLKETFRPRKIRGKLFNPKVNSVRYADDFIITGCSKELLESEVKPLVERFMFDRGLQLSPEKPASRIRKMASTSLGKTCASMSASS